MLSTQPCPKAGRGSHGYADVRMARCIEIRLLRLEGHGRKAKTEKRREVAQAHDQGNIRVQQRGVRVPARARRALVRGGVSVDDETVRKLMRELGLVPCQPRPWRCSLTEQDGSGRADPGPGQP